MLIVWEKGNGIVYYMHGNGAKNMHVEFGTDLELQQQTDYGYPYKLFHENADMTEQTDTLEDITISEQTDMSETESAQLCSDGKIIAKLGDRQTELEPNMLSLQLQENIICVYEGLNNSSQLSAAGCIAGIYDTYVINSLFIYDICVSFTFVVYPEYFLIRILALCPPNPSELLSA